MDQLNKLRLLAGLPIDPSRRTRVVVEARHVPQTKEELMPETNENHMARLNGVKRAIDHLKNAVGALESIPAIDHDGDIVHYIQEIEQLLSSDHGESGLETLIPAYTKAHDKFKRKQDERVKFEQEEEEMSRSATDAVADHEARNQRAQDLPAFEKGQKALLHGERVIIVASKDGSESVGVVPEDNENDLDALQIVDVSELEPVDKLEGTDADVSDEMLDVADDTVGDHDDEQVNDEAEDVDTDIDYDPEDGDIDETDEDDNPSDSDLEVDALSIEPEDSEEDCEMSTPMIRRAIPEGKFYYNTDDEDGNPIDVYSGNKNSNTVWKNQSPNDAKDEIPNQLFHTGKASNDQNERKVTIPANIKSMLKGAIKEVEDSIGNLSAVQQDDHFFYESLMNAMVQLLKYLEDPTVYNIKSAQVYLSSLMSPILVKIPDPVKLFIFRGGNTNNSLKDYFKPVDPNQYPILGPRQELE